MKGWLGMDFVGIFGSFGGAGVGALLAFKLQERHESNKQKREQLNTGLLALLMLEEYYNTLQSIRSEYLNGPGHPSDVWYTALCRISPASLTFEPAQLDFLINFRAKGLIRDLLIARNRFFKSLEILNERHELYYKIQSEVAEQGVKVSDKRMESLSLLNDALKLEIDADLILIPMVSEELEMSLNVQFPKSNILNFIDLGNGWRKGDLIKNFMNENCHPIRWFDRVGFKLKRLFHRSS